MAAKMEKNGERVYSDAQLEVSVDVEPNKDGVEIEYHRPLNCIKISVNSANAHFIQFATRQYPDLFEFNQSGKLQWDTEPGPFYMRDSINPKFTIKKLTP